MRIESLTADWIELRQDRLSQLPSAAGVFELGDVNRQVVYIGTARDLNKDLWQYLDPANPCLRKSKYFRISINPELQKGEYYLFQRYKDDNNGRIPPCNHRDPTRKLR